MNAFALCSLLSLMLTETNSLPRNLPEESVGNPKMRGTPVFDFLTKSSTPTVRGNENLDIIKQKLLNALNMETRPDQISKDRKFPIGPKLEYKKQQQGEDGGSSSFIVIGKIVTKDCPKENGHVICVLFHYDKKISTDSQFARMELKIPYYSTASYARQVGSGTRRTKYRSHIYVKQLVRPGETERGIVSSTSTHEKAGLVWSNIQLTHLDRFVKSTKILNTVLKIECLGCVFKEPNDLDENPVLTFQVSQNPKAKQNNCKSYNTSRCCRQEYRIDWDTLGWSDWVILPKSLEIGRCVGTCDHITYEKQLEREKISHKYLLKIIETKYLKGSEKALCCGPTKSESAQILYTDGKTFSMKTLQNARILECGCA